MKRLLILAVLSVVGAVAQQQSVTLTAVAPPAINNVSGGVIGERGGTTYFYWVIARYPVGDAQAFGPFSVFNAPATLSVSGYIRLTWGPTEGATSYAVLRSNTGLSPLSNNTCAACLVGTTANNFIEDQGGPLSAFTQVPTQSSISTQLTLNYRDFPAPITRLGQYFAWQPIGVGLLADRPTSCTGLRDAYVCTGADCPSTLALYYCTSTDTWGLIAAGGGSPGNPDRSVQFNDSGNFAGDARLVYSLLGVLHSEDGFSAGDGVDPGQFTLLEGAPPIAPSNAGEWKFFVDSTGDWLTMRPDAGSDYYVSRSATKLDCTATPGSFVTTDANGVQSCAVPAGGDNGLVFSWSSATDVATAGGVTATQALATIPANTLSQGDVCNIMGSWAFTSVGGGTWQPGITINGTTNSELIHSVAGAVTGVIGQRINTDIGIDSTTSAQYYGGYIRVSVINYAQGARTIDTTADILIRFMAMDTGAGNASDTVTFQYGRVQCFSTP